MNKTILITIFALIALSFSVSAWHCADTDAAKPKAINNHYGAWGDNALLGGTTAGWGDTTLTSLPEGCTGTWDKNAKAYPDLNCQDYCKGTTLVEYFCADRPPVQVAYQDCHWEGTGRNKHQVCETKYKTQTFWGETVLSWAEHKNSTECAQVPEFAPVAAGVALIGAIGAIAIVRRKQ